LRIFPLDIRPLTPFHARSPTVALLRSKWSHGFRWFPACAVRFCLERAALAQQQILRSYQFEAGTLSHFEDTPRELPRALYTAGRAFKNASPRGQQLPLLLRYQAQAERMYRRAIEEFERLKGNRSAPPADFPNEPILDTQPIENMQLLISEEPLSDGDLSRTSIRPDDSLEPGTRES
jgi:hypothetical protein